MTKQEELNSFIEKVDDFINSKYILADIKIVNLLKVIATSNTLLAIFKNCLANFDYEKAKSKYLVKNKLVEDRGEFILPPSSRELLALIFNILYDIDAKNIDFSDFLKKYFFEDGSFSASYQTFINSMIRPFRNSVKALMESVIDGKVQDPVEALTIEEEKRAIEREQKAKEDKKNQELLKTADGKSKKEIRDLLIKDKTKIKKSKMNENVKAELVYVIDMLGNVIESGDKEALYYAFIAYKYCAKAHKLLFFGRVKRISKLIGNIL